MTQADVIDRAVFDGLLESLGGDAEFLAELLETYFDDTPVQIATMEAALATGSAEDLRRAAHSLKSNSANFGAMALSRMCKELEEMGKAGQLAGAGDRIASVAAEYGGVRAALEAAQRAI